MSIFSLSEVIQTKTFQSVFGEPWGSEWWIIIPCMRPDGSIVVIIYNTRKRLGVKRKSSAWFGSKIGSYFCIFHELYISIYFNNNFYIAIFILPHRACPQLMFDFFLTKQDGALCMHSISNRYHCKATRTALSRRRFVLPSRWPARPSLITLEVSLSFVLQLRYRLQW